METIEEKNVPTKDPVDDHSSHADHTETEHTDTDRADYVDKVDIDNEVASSDNVENPQQEAIKKKLAQKKLRYKVIKEKRELDPLIAAKISGRDLLQHLIKTLTTNNKKVHAQSLLSAIGSLAGFSVQKALSEHAKRHSINQQDIFKIYKDDKSKTRYYFGESLNLLLSRGEHSLWEMTLDEAFKHNDFIIPDLNEMFSHAAQVAGTPLFGILRLSDFNQPSEKPHVYIKYFWPKLHPHIQEFCAEPLEWPIAYAVAAQQALRTTKDVLDMELAIRIIMESAIAASKIEYT